MTPRNLIRDAAESFRGAGVPDPEFDSGQLLSRVCGRPPLSLLLDTDTALDNSVIDRFRVLCDRRIRREPLQYILEDAPFCGRLFHVDPRVLIPRPETELLCEWATEIISGCGKPDALDLCCGSGCLGISLKLNYPPASVWLSDISADALDVAKQNSLCLGADVCFFRSDLFSSLPPRVFDLIVSNPPYIPSGECKVLQPEVSAEPITALDGGADGLDYYRRICRESPRYLRPGGWLLMELGDGECTAVKDLLSLNGFSDITIRSDYQSIDRMIGGRVS